MSPLRPHSAGLALGILLALWHLCWAILVAIGAAQPLLDFIFNLHMIAPVWTVTAFSMSKAAALVVVTGAIGYCMGAVVALIWNRFKSQH